MTAPVIVWLRRDRRLSGYENGRLETNRPHRTGPLRGDHCLFSA